MAERQLDNRRTFLAATGGGLVLAGIGALSFRSSFRERHLDELRTEARCLSQEMFAVIRSERINRDHPVSPFDPGRSGLLGLESSTVTSLHGSSPRQTERYLRSKQCSIELPWSDYYISKFSEVGLRAGDPVSIGVTGSFPALNIQLFAAVKTYGLTPTIVGSVGSSQFGANIPTFLWPDMEHALVQAGLLPFRAIGYTRGGKNDVGANIERPDLLDRSIERIQRSYPQLLHPDIQSVDDGIAFRTKLFFQSSTPPSLIINNGGGAAQREPGIEPGLNTSLDRDLDYARESIAVRSIRDHGVPFLNLQDPRDLAESSPQLVAIAERIRTRY